MDELDYKNVSSVEDPKELSENKDTLHSWRRWHYEIERARTSDGYKRWDKLSKGAYRRFASYEGGDNKYINEISSYSFNLFWTITQIFEAILFPWDKLPNPEVQDRYKDADPISNAASEIYERFLTYKTDDIRIESAIRDSIQDFLIGGLGQTWVRYDAETQDVSLDFIHRKDFLCSDSKRWEDVTWVARRLKMKRSELIDKFGELGRGVRLSSDDDEKYGRDEDFIEIAKYVSTADIWEIWDKDSGQIIYVPEAWEDKYKERKDIVLRVEPDSYGLKGFFPCPKPLFATQTTDSVWPYPDWHFYKYLIAQIDELTERTSNLIGACKLKALYVKGTQGIQELIEDAAEGDFIPVDFEAFGNGTKLNDVIMFWPIAETANALRVVTEIHSMFLQLIEQIIGVSDIMRGVTKASESARAQTMKGQYASLRMKTKQGAVMTYIRDIYEIIGDIGVSKISPEYLSRMIGGPGVPMELSSELSMAMEFLRRKDDVRFKIDIETSETAAIDEGEDKQRRVEFLHAFGQFMNMSVPMLQTFPQMAEPVVQIMMFAVRGFKAGRMVQSSLEQGLSSITKMIQEKANNPQPNPDQMKMQMEQAKAQMEAQIAQMSAQMEAQSKQLDLAIKEREGQINIEIQQQKLELERQKAELKIQSERLKLAFESEKHQSKLEADRVKATQDIIITQQKAEASQNEQANRDI